MRRVQISTNLGPKATYFTFEEADSSSRTYKKLFKSLKELLKFSIELFRASKELFRAF